MAIDSVQTTTHVADFIAYVRDVVASDGVTEMGLQRIAERMRDLTARDDLYPGITHADLRDDDGAVRLHAEDDGTLNLSLARFAADEPTRASFYG
jgi:hypothetical protein